MTDGQWADDQSGVTAFLAERASYGLTTAVDRIETHCSIVFLAGDRAYKLKRAIRYSSLDYTTLDRRRAACEAELRLNRRTAPDLYLEVRSINRDANGELRFAGTGPAVDFVVVMRRFDQSELFDRLAERHALSPELMATLGAAIARFHLSAKLMPDFGGGDAIRRVIANNEQELARVALALDGIAVETLSGRAHAAVDAVAPLLEQRRLGGKVRRCHGDLRLANICLWSGQPTLFDCIEFSEEIGCIDVLYDLAFLLMDLHLRERGDLANAVFNAWLDVMPETDGLRVLPLFLALRAATRSYALAGGSARQEDPQQAAKLLAQARRHVRASLDFLLPPRPMLVVLAGDNADDRCDLATRLAAEIPPAPGARIVRLAGAEAASWREAGDVLSAGCSVVIDAATADTACRQASELASRIGVPSAGFFLSIPRSGFDRRLWQTVDASGGVAAALAAVRPMLVVAND